MSICLPSHPIPQFLNISQPHLELVLRTQRKARACKFHLLTIINGLNPESRDHLHKNDLHLHHREGLPNTHPRAVVERLEGISCRCVTLEIFPSCRIETLRVVAPYTRVHVDYRRAEVDNGALGDWDACNHHVSCRLARNICNWGDILVVVLNEGERETYQDSRRAGPRVGSFPGIAASRYRRM